MKDDFIISKGGSSRFNKIQIIKPAFLYNLYFGWRSEHRYNAVNISEEEIFQHCAIDLIRPIKSLKSFSQSLVFWGLSNSSVQIRD